MTIGWHFDNSYYKLPKSFREEVEPVPVKKPELVIFNEKLASNLGLDFSNLNKNEISNILSGNDLPRGSNSIAQAYAGHQFGNFTMLGDGRAVLIGEHISRSQERFDIQFKGSGKTSFSRGGDGRAALGPMLREYIISEAMHGLKIPTTRSLAVVKTGETVIREEKLPGAILTRVASSHIRVGTFQYIAARDNINDLKTLTNYVINRHYSYLENKKNKYLELFKEVVKKQIQLVVNWIRVGFVHGVMNTDNMLISGESIDYGPCAFINSYNPEKVFSSIDQFGRYAFLNQPKITKWNLIRFAECLIPLFDSNEKKSIDLASEIIDDYENQYEREQYRMMKCKLGLIDEDKEDKEIISSLLNIMKTNKYDYTNTFCYLMDMKNFDFNKFENLEFLKWKEKWTKRTISQKKKSLDLMRKNNPIVIPRNHLIEKILEMASNDNFDQLNKFIKNIQNPYRFSDDKVYYQEGPDDSNYRNFCGT